MEQQLYRSFVAKNCFLETRPADPSQWRLLILDTFTTHIDSEFQLAAFQNKVQLLFIPANTSHRLQPLDVACFGPPKTVYCRAVAETRMSTLSSPASKRRFITIYEDSRNRCLNSSNIEASFKATGIWPVQPSRVLNELL